METSPTILVVEDEILIALDLVAQLEEWGFSPVGPCSSVQHALAALEAATPDAALLDMNLGRDGTSEPIAMALQERGVPFLFLTGYSAHPLSFEGLSGQHPLTKPCPTDVLLRELNALTGRTR